MSEQTREEKAIDRSNEVLKSFQSDFGVDNKVTLEYNKLLNDYVRLSKRLNKMIKISDAHSLGVVHKSEKIQTFAKKKIIDNISTQRKSKEKYLSEIEAYKTKINELEEVVKFLKSKLIKDKKEVKMVETNPLYDYDETFESIVQDEIVFDRRSDDLFCIAVVALNDYDHISGKFDNKSTFNNFLFNLSKFFSNAIKKCVVRYHKENKFYILLKNVQLEKAKYMLSTIDKPIKIDEIRMTFKIGLTEYIDGENSEDILHRACSLCELIENQNKQTLIMG